MTTLAPRAALGGPRNGGVAARRAVIRWAGRMLRREWRQQILVLALLTVAVTAAVGSITIASNAAPADDGEFGSANQLLRFDGSDPRKLEAGLAAATKAFGTTDVIGHRSFAVPGGVETVDFRSQDPDGPYGDALLALRRGQLPGRPAPGRRDRRGGGAPATRDRLDAGARRRRRTVVGIVENPSKLSDEFALVPPSSAGRRSTSRCSSRRATTRVHSFQDSLARRSAFVGHRTRGTSQQAPRRWRSSPWPPSSSSSPRWSPRRVSRSSRSDGSASSACSPPSARRRSTSASCCWRTAPSSGRRRAHRDDRRPRALGRRRPGARVRRRPSHRPAQPSAGS